MIVILFNKNDTQLVKWMEIACEGGERNCILMNFFIKSDGVQEYFYSARKVKDFESAEESEFD